MDDIEPAVPAPKPLSEESLALQEAESKHETFLFFRRLFIGEGDHLERGQDGEPQSAFEVLPLDKDNYTVGRHPNCDLVLDWDPAISRSHASLTKAGGNWYLEDLASENGTSVNGVRASHTRLVDGDQLRLGDSIVVFRHLDESSSPDTVKARESMPIVTDVQRQVLVALSEPLFGSESLKDPATNAEVAGRLHLSVDSVKGHLRQLYKVFGIGAEVPQNRKRRSLADEAVRRGVVTHRDYP